MSLLRQWKEAENQRQAEEAAQRALNERIAELSVHPLVRAGQGRDVREAYFYGLVYAGICDDLKIDETEERLLATVGSALVLDADYVSEAVSHVRNVDNDTKMALFAETLCIIKGLSPVELRRLFAAEFAKVRLLHAENEPDLAADFKEIGEGIGMSLESDLDALKNVIKAGASATMKDIDKASVLLGDEVVKYLVVHEMGRIDDALDQFREQEENRRTLPARLASIVESDDTWPVEFKPADYQPLFAAAGILDSDVAAFVAEQLLPRMKAAFERAIGQIAEVRLRHEDTGRVWHGVQFDSHQSFRILFRYAFLINAYVDLATISPTYVFVGRGESDWDYCGCKGRCIWYEGRAYDVALDRLSLDDWGLPSGTYVDVYASQWQELFGAIAKAYG